EAVPVTALDQTQDVAHRWDELSHVDHLSEVRISCSHGACLPPGNPVTAAHRRRIRRMVPQFEAEAARSWGRRVPQTLISVGPILTVILIVFTMPDDAGLGITGAARYDDVIGYLLI